MSEVTLFEDELQSIATKKDTGRKLCKPLEWQPLFKSGTCNGFTFEIRTWRTERIARKQNFLCFESL